MGANMDYQFLMQCTKLVSTLMEMKQQGTVCVKVGNFNFEFSNTAKKHSPSPIQQKRNEERKASFERKKNLINASDEKKKMLSVEVQTQVTSVRDVDSEIEEVFHIQKQKLDLQMQWKTFQLKRSQENQIKFSSAQQRQIQLTSLV